MRGCDIFPTRTVLAASQRNSACVSQRARYLKETKYLKKSRYRKETGYLTNKGYASLARVAQGTDLFTEAGYFKKPAVCLEAEYRKERTHLKEPEYLKEKQYLTERGLLEPE